MGQTLRLARTAVASAAVTLLFVQTAARVEAQAPHRCAADATGQAAKLLAFHLGSTDRIEIAPTVKTLAPIRNPADRRQRFDVLEIWGYVEKGEYRMRFLYARLPGPCVLMGQEILEHAAL